MASPYDISETIKNFSTHVERENYQKSFLQNQIGKGANP